MLAWRRRANMPAAAAPNSSSIGGAGTSVPPFDVLVVVVEPLPELLEVEELVELELDEVTLPEVDELVELDEETLPELELDEETLPEVLDEVDE